MSATTEVPNIWLVALECVLWLSLQYSRCAGHTPFALPIGFNQYHYWSPLPRLISHEGAALDACAISGSVATTVNTLSLRRPVNVALETSSRLSILIACGVLSAETLAIAALGFTS